MEIKELVGLQDPEDCRERMVQMVMDSQEPKDKRGIMVSQVILDLGVNGGIQAKMEVLDVKAMWEEGAMLEIQDRLVTLVIRGCPDTGARRDHVEKDNCLTVS